MESVVFFLLTLEGGSQGCKPDFKGSEAFKLVLGYLFRQESDGDWRRKVLVFECEIRV